MRLASNEFLPLGSVKIKDGFWSRYQDIAKNKIIPYQWRAINDRIPGVEPSRAIANFRKLAMASTRTRNWKRPRTPSST